MTPERRRPRLPRGARELPRDLRERLARGPQGARRLVRGVRGRLRQRLNLRRIRAFVGPADLLTLTNGFCGLLAIATFAFESGLFDRRTPDPYVAMVLIGIGLVADALDGVVARKFGSSQLGGDLDTIADAITFVCAPAVMIIGVYGTATYPQFNATPAPFGSMVAAGLVFLFGILRLARFNSNPDESETKTFTGLPTPWMTVMVTLMVVLQVRAEYALPATAILAFLMVSSVAYPKSRGQMVYLTFAMIAAGVAAVVTIVLVPRLTFRVLQALLVLATLAIAVSPLFLARSRRRGGGPPELDEPAREPEPVD